MMRCASRAPEASLNKPSILQAFALGLLFTAGFVAPSTAQTSVESFFKGRTISMLVGFAPGGVNDISARAVARHLPRFLPGSPNIVVQNQPSAGGLTVSNFIYNAAPKDGSVIASLDRGSSQLAIQGDVDAKFDPLKFNWFGSISSYARDAYMLLVNSSNAAKSVADIKGAKPSIKLGAVSAGSSNLVFALVAKEVLGLNVDIIRGYTGAAPMFLAMQSGELDGQVVGLSSTRAGQPDLWARKLARPLVQFGRTTRLPELADVPTGRELAADDNARSLVAFAELPFFMALPFAAPPGLPPERAKAFEDAFISMSRDPAFIAEAEKLGLDVSPISADQLRDLLVRSAATPADVIARYNTILSPKR
jgi:tripartite-type tricarboxylate transporter receptor subunit TctC